MQAAYATTILSILRKASWPALLALSGEFRGKDCHAAQHVE